MSCDRCGKPTPPLVSDEGGFYGGVGSVCSCGGIHREDKPKEPVAPDVDECDFVMDYTYGD